MMPKGTPFLALGRRDPSFEQGYRAAIKDCGEWLKLYANGAPRRDQKALGRAATDMGTEANAIMDMWRMRDDLA